MSENTPDRANPADSLDVPTYQQPNIHERVGRAAPQQIPAQGAAPAESEAESQPKDEHSAPLASDAPTTAFDEVSVDQPAAAPAQDTTVAEPATTPAAVVEPAVDPAPTTVAPAVVPAATPVAEPEEPMVLDEKNVTVVSDRRGTLNFGLFLIRATVAAVLIAHSVVVFFGLGSSAGLSGLQADYAAYNQPSILSVLIPSLELTAGAFLLLGLITPVAASLGLVATGFAMLHDLSTNGLRDTAAGHDSYAAIMLFLLVLGLLFTGPGRWSLDFSRSWVRRPLASSWIFALVGIGGLVATWWFLAGTF